MSDNLTHEHRLKAMRAVKAKGTRLERRFSSMLAGMNLRGWKKNVDNVLGKPDVVFEALRLAIFLDGCFWHGCPFCHKKLPSTNRDYWEKKISRNKSLARSYTKKLRKNGWIVVRVWEHELSSAVTMGKLRRRLYDLAARN